MKKAVEKPLSEQTYAELIHNAYGENGKEACAELWNRMDENDPAKAEEFVRSITDTARGILDKSFPGAPVEREAYRRKFRKMRLDLGWESVSALERLLIERIVLCWFHLNQSELRQEQAFKKGISLEEAAVHQKFIDRCQKRYLSAIQSLVVVRRLAVPAVQLNISENQVNVLQGATPEAKRITQA